MNRLEYLIVREIERHRGSKSFATIAREKVDGRQMARQWYAGGYKLTELRQLRGKSVDFIRDIWAGRRADPETGKIRVIGSGTQATRMTTLRAICRYAGKPGLVPKSNKAAGLPPRERTPVADIAWKLSDQDLGKVNNANARLVLRLQQEFGLRKKEGFLLDARRCDKGPYLVLDRGTKGGQRRQVPIVTDEQRKLLAAVKVQNRTTPGGTLVSGASLKGAFNEYKLGMAHAELTHGHGLRHGYAQARYETLTGWPSPKSGGLKPGQLSEDDLVIDARVRAELALELGHKRAGVMNTYIGGD